MSGKLQVRRGTDAQRQTMILDSGELGYAQDTKQLYIGDGTTYGGNPVTSTQISFKNELINGNFDFWQRGTSLAAATGSRYCADRWQSNGIGTTTVAPSQQAFTLGQVAVPNNPAYYHRCVVAAGAAATDGAVFYQPIEGLRKSSGKNRTLSFWAKADAAKNIAIELSQVFGTGGSPSATINAIGSQLVALTTTWQKFSITIAVPAIAGKTLGTNSDDNLLVAFWFDAGTNFSARAASLGHQSGTFDIAQVQFEDGAVATPFELRPVGIELALCQRYCYSQLLPPGGAFAVGQQYSGTGAMAQVNVPVSMRSAAPTLTVGGSIRWTGAATGSTNPTLAVGTPSQFLLLFTVSGGAQYGGGYAAASGGAAQLTFDAEL